MQSFGITSNEFTFSMSFGSSHHIGTFPSYVLRDILFPPLYAKHSKMKMFKFRPRLVSGKRRSKVFWRVVVNIFIFRNSQNIHSAFFLAHSIQPSQTRRCLLLFAIQSERSAQTRARGEENDCRRVQRCVRIFMHI